jgi:hypothetical protein
LEFIQLLGLYKANYFNPCDPYNLSLNFVLFKVTNFNINHINLMNATWQCTVWNTIKVSREVLWTEKQYIYFLPSTFEVPPCPCYQLNSQHGALFAMVGQVWKISLSYLCSATVFIFQYYWSLGYTVSGGIAFGRKEGGGGFGNRGEAKPHILVFSISFRT